MAYLDELERLDSGLGRVRLVPFDEDHQLIDLNAAATEAGSDGLIYCCGPEPLLDAAEQLCHARGIRLRTERFSPREIEEVQSASFTVRLASSDRELTVAANQSLLDVLLDAGADVLSSCGEGTCGTCETAVLDGIPDHPDSVLTDEERARGDCMMVCVSRARTPILLLDL